ncbi:B-cell receptor-associated protein 31-like [Glossina fuscipes]|uniref:Endoplasmic reticulum transmembrane protein n=1 Tax=Glossina fuscipes TaxID=7396 RepID=A0A9C6DQG2_9MUSC|nr:B-cell receptor-associated protein 31-like [Glossina fuscipes]
MDLVWTLLTGFLYAEICVVLLLVLPVASPHKWNRFFKSTFLATITRRFYLYFFLIMGVLVLFLFEAIREMRIYSNWEHSSDVPLSTKMQHSMRFFRAQRNIYISGFLILLVLVIRRLVRLISVQAQSEASLKQAQSASAIIRSLMEDRNTEKVDEAKEDMLLGVTTKPKERIHELVAELNRETKDKEHRNTEKVDEAKEDITLTEITKIKERIHELEEDRTLAVITKIKERIHELTAELNRDKKNKEDKNIEKAGEAKEERTLAVITKIKERIHVLTGELKREQKDQEALKSQAASLTKEYDHLTEEYSVLQQQMNIIARRGDKANRTIN